MPLTKAQNATAAGLALRTAAAEVDKFASVGKIDWIKLIELLMQFLPLILAFFQPEEEKPKV